MKKHRFVGKFLPRGSHMAHWWESMRVFQRETTFYTQIAPLVEKDLGKAYKHQYQNISKLTGNAYGRIPT